MVDSVALSRAMKSFRALSIARMISSSFNWVALVDRLALFWITNTIQNVTTVVVVLMNSCHVSEKLKIGPVSAQTTTRTIEAASTSSEPRLMVSRSARWLKRSRSVGAFGGCMSATVPRPDGANHLHGASIRYQRRSESPIESKSPGRWPGLLSFSREVRGLEVHISAAAVTVATAGSCRLLLRNV